MIAVELTSVVCEEPVDDRLRGDPVTEPVRLFASSGYLGRIRYLPQLALVVVEHKAGYATIVPVEHVCHMATVVDEVDVVDVLASVIP